MQNKDTWRGFTLIELLVVVLIIGILAAVAVPQYQLAVMKSRYAVLKDLTNAIAQAQEIYYLENGVYADDFAKLSIEMPGQKLSNSTPKQYEYEWGKCHMGSIGDQAICWDTGIHMQYQRRLIYSKDDRYNTCVIIGTTDTTDKRNRLCKAETGAAQPTISHKGNYILWKYTQLK